MISSAAPKQGVLQNLFPGWLSGWQSSAGETPEAEGTSTMAVTSKEGPTMSEEDQLLDELGYEEDNILFKDRIFLSLNFSLAGGTFQLMSTPPMNLSESFFGPDPLMEVAFKLLCFSIDLRPRLKYFSFDLSLGSVSLIDHSDSNQLFPVLVKPRESKVKFLLYDLFVCV